MFANTETGNKVAKIEPMLPWIVIPLTALSRWIFFSSFMLAGRVARTCLMSDAELLQEVTLPGSWTGGYCMENGDYVDHVSSAQEVV